jgi:hypothetical protein
MSQDGLGTAPTLSSSGTAPATQGGTGSAATRLPDRSSRSAGSPSQGVPAPGAVATAGGTAIHPGGTIQVGFTYFKDATAGLNAIGVSGTLGDQRAYATVMVNDANARGGLGGKKIVPVFFGYDANPGAASIPDQDAAACATFTQDNHIKLAVPVLAGPNLLACLRHKGIPMVAEGSSGGFSSAQLTEDRLLFETGAFNLDRRATEQVKALEEQAYFQTWNNTAGGPGAMPVKVGVIVYDRPDWIRSVNGPLSSALQSAGHGRPEVVAVAPHDSYDQLSTMSAQISSAVLRFKAHGVTHVVVWDDNGVSTLFFMKDAENQHFRPRYGINSGNNMDLLVGDSLVADAQVKGAVGMGWTPLSDLPKTESGPSSTYSNAPRRACDALMARHDQSGSKYNESFALQFCNAVSTMKRVADAVGTDASQFVSGMEALGSSLLDPLTPRTYIGPRNHDGNGGIYRYVYDETADKMAYRGGVVALSHA